MLKLRDIMTADVVTVSPDQTIRDAMELLTARHVSGAPVVDGGQVVGVVSATDLLAFVAALPGLTSAELARGANWGEPEAATGWDDEGEPSTKYFSVLWEGLNLRDALIAETGEPTWDALDDHTIVEAMTRAPVHSMPSDASVDAAADYMRRAEIHRILVMDGGKLVGMVSTMDVVKAVASHRLMALHYVFGAPRTGGRPRRARSS
jgi:CBS domain-containing protein